MCQNSSKIVKLIKERTKATYSCKYFQTKTKQSPIKNTIQRG